MMRGPCSWQEPRLRTPGRGLVVCDGELGKWSLEGPRSPQQAVALTQLRLVGRCPAAAEPALGPSRFAG